MMPTKLLETDKVALYYYPAEKIVHHELKSFVFGEQFRSVLEKGLEAFERFGATKWLSDDRGNGPLTSEDSTWALTEWAPRVMRAGWKFWAVVMPEKVLGQLNMKRWIKEYAERGVTVRAFTDPNEAMDWLKRQ